MQVPRDIFAYKLEVGEATNQIIKSWEKEKELSLEAMLDLPGALF
jgi:hypothetical protein